MTKYKLGEIIELNPRESIKKGNITRKIAMDDLGEFKRDIESYSYSEYKGGTKFRNYDTLMARITPCLENGKTSFVNILEENEVAFGSTEYFVFRAKQDIINPYYLYYLVTTDKFREVAIKSMSGTSGRQRVQKDQILDFSVDLPSLEDQEKIMKPLKLIDDKISLNTKLNTNLNSLLECVFNNYYHHKNDTVSTKLELISEVRSANRIFAKEYRNEGIPFLRGKEISLLSQGNSPTDTLFISIEKYKKLKNIPKAKDILVTSVGTIGNIYQVENFRLPFYYKDGNIIQITPHKGFENYIYLWLNSKFGDKEIVSATIGSTQKALTISAIKKFKLYILNNHELQRFNHIVNPLIKQIQQNHEENDFLQDLKSTLLKRYF
ncbi:restriction endonuclease subunit S [Ligilactobacillus salivarius]|uniref:restriction endonuclease subunit S n=1 Tax=Ligilactobacillus salivarius TaxID=1624 RepID=UPI000BD27721|nr:restriction endonuclease subunit S [Ligilactobacillus salivarius]PAY48931.1 hypothetical protein A8C55_11040 [Ligilactobacillus salivarius]